MADKNTEVIVLEQDGKYAEKYSESGLFDKIKNAVKSAGLKLIYEAL